jgi:phage I-like protein
VGEKIIRASFSAFDGIEAPDKVPSEICLLKSGVNSYVDGELLFDADAAKSVMSRYQKRGLKLKADYEHQSLSVPPVQAPASARKWVPEVRNGELWATDIQWTKKARQMIADGEYDYFSIAARTEQKSGRVVEMINFALTNLPAANGIEPLIAASIAKKENDMKTVIVALGLRADAEEADALAAVSSLKEFERDAVVALGVKDRAAAMGAIVAMKAVQLEADAAKKELATLKQSTVDAECKRLIDDATTAGKLPPAKRAEVEGLYGKYGIDAVKATLSVLPVIAPSASDAPKPVVAPVVTDGEFSPTEIAIAKNIVGSDPERLTKHLNSLRDYKRARANGGR